MAAVLLEWHLESPYVTIWNCAMPALQVYRQGKLVTEVASQSLALGIVEPFYGGTQPTTLKVQTGDLLFGFTDGFLDARSPQGLTFAQTDLGEALDDVLSLGLPLSYLQTRLQSFVGQAGVQDDAMVLEIRV
jgi:serine phosphatase RsbU (regulator of sigma subunit)